MIAGSACLGGADTAGGQLLLAFIKAGDKAGEALAYVPDFALAQILSTPAT